MRIGIIGHFGGKQIFNDGQTVKTITLYNALIKRKPNDVNIDVVDTFYIKRNSIRFIIILLKSLLRDKKIIVLLSENGRRVLFPVLFVFAKYFNKDIYHYAIGGQLGKEVIQNKKWKKYINSFRANWMESSKLVTTLKEVGVMNAVYMPNFKSLKVLNPSELVYSKGEPYRFCTFSRVMAEKGIEDAINAIAEINRKSKKTRVKLDIYGPIEKGYDERFKNLLANNPDSEYCGIVEQNNSVDKLKNYFALLFPTYWKGEGMPGTVIDAYCSGIPIIARWWPVCDELIEHNKTGIIYPKDHPEDLPTCITEAINNPDLFNAMKLQCLERATSFCEETIIKRISEEMGVHFA